MNLDLKMDSDYSFRPVEKKTVTHDTKAQKMGLDSWDKDLDRYLDSTNSTLRSNQRLSR